MERKQQSNESVVAEQKCRERVEEQPVRRSRLQIVALEERVAPNAVWGE